MNQLPIQQSIVARINALFVFLTLTPPAYDLPDSPADYQKAAVGPLVYVVYAGSKAEPSVSTSITAQLRTLTFNVEIHARSLYSENGLHAYRDVVERALIGFEPTNAQRITLAKDDITQTEDNIWVHVLTFECKSMLVQVDLTDEQFAANFLSMYLKAGADDINPDQIIPVTVPE